VRSFELSRAEAVAIVPLCLIILALAFFPQFGLSKSENSMRLSTYAAGQPGGNASLQLPSAQSADLTGWWSYPGFAEIRLAGGRFAAMRLTARRPRRIYTYTQVAPHRKVHS
jgi:hypothetical protein